MKTMILALLATFTLNGLAQASNCPEDFNQAVDRLTELKKNYYAKKFLTERAQDLQVFESKYAGILCERNGKTIEANAIAQKATEGFTRRQEIYNEELARLNTHSGQPLPGVSHYCGLATLGGFDDQERRMKFMLELYSSGGAETKKEGREALENDLNKLDEKYGDYICLHYGAPLEPYDAEEVLSKATFFDLDWLKEEYRKAIAKLSAK